MTRDTEPMRVFVHLAYGFGARSWEALWTNGTLVGVNERLPYGYFHAGDHGCRVIYSEDKPERKLERFFRLALRAVLGFDFVHAWRNRAQIQAADVVWTHTESQHLAVSCLLRTKAHRHRPKLLAQSVWLFDRWPRYSFLRRQLFAWLVSQADILTVHSPENLKVARALFPALRSDLVLYGIAAERKRHPGRSSDAPPLRILSAGNDIHRDWATLVEAIGNLPGIEVRIVSSRISHNLVRGAMNVKALRPRTNAELLDLYESADMLVLALEPNLHASGITVIQEAALLGVAVVCTDTGGLRAYFSDDEVVYVPPHNAPALRQAVRELAADHERRWRLAERAQARMGDGGLSSRSFALRHVELSRELLASSETAALR